MYKVMIVEDDEIISNSIAGYLQKWQYTTHEVVDFQNVVKEFCGTITGLSINGY